MSVNLEQIETLKQRANVSYGEAKEVLEACNGDVLEAIISLEKQSKLKAAPKAACCTSGFWNTTKRLIKKGNEIKFVVKKEEHNVVDVPLNVAIIVTAVMAPLTVAGVLLAVFTNHKIRFINPNGEGMGINNTIDKFSNAVNSVSSQVAEAIKK